MTSRQSLIQIVRLSKLRDVMRKCESNLEEIVTAIYPTAFHTKLRSPPSATIKGVGAPIRADGLIEVLKDIDTLANCFKNPDGKWYKGLPKKRWLLEYGLRHIGLFGYKVKQRWPHACANILSPKF